MALVARRAELATMNIRVAIRAFASDIRKHQIDVAGAARNVFMQAAQRKLRLAVIEIRQRPNRLPTGKGVAILARGLQRAVRAARALRHLRRGLRRDCRNGKKSERERELQFLQLGTCLFWAWAGPFDGSLC